METRQDNGAGGPDVSLPFADDVRPRRPLWVTWVVLALLYSLGGLAAYLLRDYLDDLTLWSYVVADVGGLAFLLRYIRTDWRAHAWGRHVMAFMICLELLFTIAGVMQVAILWPGLREVGFHSSATLAGIVWWRYRLQVTGGRRAASRPDSVD